MLNIAAASIARLGDVRLSAEGAPSPYAENDAYRVLRWLMGGLGGVDIDNLGASLTEKSDAPSCEDVQWRFLGVSMAGYNLLASAGLFALTLFAALAETRAARRVQRTATI